MTAVEKGIIGFHPCGYLTWRWMPRFTERVGNMSAMVDMKNETENERKNDFKKRLNFLFRSGSSVLKSLSFWSFVWDSRSLWDMLDLNMIWERLLLLVVKDSTSSDTAQKERKTEAEEDKTRKSKWKIRVVERKSESAGKGGKRVKKKVERER